MAQILIVEDEIDVRHSLMDLLSVEGFEAIAVADGIEALSCLEQVQPDLILCDIELPRMDGYRVLTELRRNPSTATLPIIFLTGRSRWTQVRYGMEQGADDYLLKPFSPNDLLRAIAAQLRKKTATTHAVNCQVDALRGQISRILPHELKTPLTTILSSAEFLIHDHHQLPATTLDEMLGLILQSGQRLHRLTENMLLYASLLLGTVETAKRDIMDGVSYGRIGPALTRIAHEVAQRYLRLGDLHLQIGDRTVVMGEQYFTKIAEEIIDNAFKFSKPGQRVEVKLQIQDQSCLLEVSDRGCGMTSKQLAQAGAYVQFERQRHEQQGSGLGLAIVHHLVQLQQGRICIHSSPASLTCVQVSLPMVDPWVESYPAVVAKKASNSINCSGSNLVCMGQNLGPPIEQNSVY